MLPTSPDEQLQTALSLHQTGHLDEARALYESILSKNPRHAEAIQFLGLVHHQKGDNDRAAVLIAQAVEWEPRNAAFHYNLGVVLQKLKRDADAEECYRKSIAMDAANVSAWVNLGNLLTDAGRPGEGCDCHRNALRLQPGLSEHHLRMGRSLRILGDIENALSQYGNAVALAPSDHAAQSALLFCGQYETGITLAELSRRHRAWASTLPAPDPQPKKKKADKKKEFRVGFLSPDLGNHPVGIFIAPLLERLKRSEEIVTICINDREVVDEYVLRNRTSANEWIEVAGSTNEALFETLREAKLDVLVELTGHTDNNRLPVLARRPVPIQMTWAGYVGTTGLDAIDYLITDAFHNPDGSEDFCSETLIRFPNGYICYEPPAYAPDAGPLPMSEAGHVTFGCFNNPSKINATTIALWSEIMRALPDSRLILKYKGMDDPVSVQRIHGRFAVFGINPGRVEILGQSTHIDHLNELKRVDIALDPTPYAGGLTTCEAIWMGVPVITLPGETFASRHSLSHLSNAGFPEWVAESREDYVRKAVDLASNAPRLAKLRKGMREQVKASPLCDLDGYANDFAMAIRLVTESD